MSYAQHGFERCVLGYGALSDSVQYLSIVVNACKLLLGRGLGISNTRLAKYWSRIDYEWKDVAAHAPSTSPASCQIVGTVVRTRIAAMQGRSLPETESRSWSRSRRRVEWVAALQELGTADKLVCLGRMWSGTVAVPLMDGLWGWFQISSGSPAGHLFGKNVMLCWVCRNTLHFNTSELEKPPVFYTHLCHIMCLHWHGRNLLNTTQNTCSATLGV